MRHPRPLAILPCAALALFPLHSLAAAATQTFDDARPGPILPGDMVNVTGITLSTRDGTTAAIKAVPNPDEYASGLAVGAADDGSSVSLNLHFARPQPMVSFTLVLPPGAPTDVALASVLERDATRRDVVGVEHRATEQRVRMRLHGNGHGTVDDILLNLRDGAYVDNVSIQTADEGDACAIVDPAQLPLGSMAGRGDIGDTIIAPSSHLLVGIEPTTGFQMLTGDQADGNDAHFVFRCRRDTVEVTLAAPAESDATLTFLQTKNSVMEPVHTTQVKKGDTRACFRVTGPELQGLHWTGGNLKFGRIELRSQPTGICETR